MKKRQRPKKWYEDRLAELYKGLNDLHTRLKRVEGVIPKEFLKKVHK